MKIERLLLAALVAAATLTVTPAQAMDPGAVLPSVSVCTVQECVDAVCATQNTVNCDIECHWAAATSGADVRSCIPVCPAYAGSYACSPCIQPRVDDLTWASTAYACPLPCTQWYEGSNPCVPCLQTLASPATSAVAPVIACPRPPCDYWNMLVGTTCPVCPWPPSTLQACHAICPEGARELCGLCDRFATDPCEPCNVLLPSVACDPCSTVPCTICTATFPDCMPCPPIPGEGEGGLVPVTIRYGNDMEAIACGAVHDEAVIVLAQAGATTDYVTGQVPPVPCRGGCRLTLPPDHGLVDSLADTGATTAVLVCDFTLGAGTCTTENWQEAGTCPADVPESGGVVGATLDLAEVSCQVAEQGAAESAAAAQAIAADADARADALVAYAEAEAASRVAAAEAFAATTAANADAAAGTAVAAAQAGVATTCAYLVGGSSCV